ncbi:IS110 family transposase [Salinibacter ruber]|uniref:Transposase n=1 Tax=Salinibacter ruber TaxID=146919 RepID=A0A9X2V8U9_9BACT|nr:transposase [Salinibacter ruber]
MSRGGQAGTPDVLKLAHTPTPSVLTAKTASPSLPTTYVGIDVSKDHLDACRKSGDQDPGDQDPGDQNLGNQSPKEQRDARRFPNTPAGHRRLLGWLATSSSGKVQAVVESTGRCSLDLTLLLCEAVLCEADDTEVMVANPKALRGFAKAQMRRTKTDAVDAAVIADYARRMSFSPWEPPPEATRELRAIARRIQALTAERILSSGPARKTACSHLPTAGRPHRSLKTTSKSTSVISSVESTSYSDRQWPASTAQSPSRRPMAISRLWPSHQRAGHC